MIALWYFTEISGNFCGVPWPVTGFSCVGIIFLQYDRYAFCSIVKAPVCDDTQF